MVWSNISSHQSITKSYCRLEKKVPHGIYSDLMGFYGDLMGFYADLMGFIVI